MNGYGRRYPPIGDYALIGDMRSCALVSRDGSVDWACFPRFDSAAAFSRILDWERGGYFRIAPRGVYAATRRYLPDTNVLETTFETRGGTATLTDFMPVPPSIEQPRESGFRQKIARVLKCTRGSIDWAMTCAPRFDYGTIVPDAHLQGDNWGFAHGGADALSIYTTATLALDGEAFTASGTLREGEHLHACVAHEESFSHMTDGMEIDNIERWLEETSEFWRAWAARATYEGEFRDEVVRAALVLKSLTYEPTGAIVAAPTTSLPEAIGGERNWDYRFTWIRDATLVLYSLYILGYREEAEAFNAWLEWSTLGRARDLQPMYGIGGERRLTEQVLPELSGYRDSAPVRIGNAAYKQFQLDVYGELVDSAHQFRRFGGAISEDYWQYMRGIAAFVLDAWREPDEGIWETRGGRQHFVLSKVMCWVALDRAIKAARALGRTDEIEAWVRARKAIRADVDAHGFDAERGVFVQSYGSKRLDAANLLLPLVGFIKATDPRMRATIEATARELTSPQGFVYRYLDYDDGLRGREGTFLICTFWLADNLIMLGEIDRARALFDRARATANDLGLFGEQYDANDDEILGNFPQAFSHLGFINTAVQLDRAMRGATHARGDGTRRA